VTNPDELALTAVSVPFWDSASRGELALQRCDECQKYVWYPRAICPHCGSMSLTWTAASGNGTIYAISVHHKAPRPELEALIPYAIVLVDLDEGVRMMARLAGRQTEQVGIGDRVRWRPDPEGGRAFLFETI